MLVNMFLVCVSHKTDTGIFEIVPVCTVAATYFFIWKNESNYTVNGPFFMGEDC